MQLNKSINSSLPLLDVCQEFQSSTGASFSLLTTNLQPSGSSSSLLPAVCLIGLQPRFGRRVKVTIPAPPLFYQ